MVGSGVKLVRLDIVSNVIGIKLRLEGLSQKLISKEAVCIGEIRLRAMEYLLIFLLGLKKKPGILAELS